MITVLAAIQLSSINADPEYQMPPLQVYQQQISSTQEHKNKEFLKDQKKQKEFLSRDKKASSQKKMLIFQINIALNKKLQRLQKPSNKRRKKDVKVDLETLNNKRRNLQEQIFLMSKLRENKLVNLPNKKGHGIQPRKFQ